jgi:peptide/nickel transport system substrate-binding protein
VAAGMVENAQAFQQVMKPAGINVKLKQHSPTAYWNKGWMQTSAFQDYWNPRHPADMLSLFYRTGATWNEPRYSDPKLDSLIDGVFQQVDTGAQRKAIQDAFAYAVENVGYSIPTWSESGWVNKKSLKGLELNYTDYVSLTKAWLDA